MSRGLRLTVTRRRGANGGTDDRRRGAMPSARIILGLLIAGYAVAAIAMPGAVLPSAVLSADSISPPEPVLGPTTVIADPAPAAAASSEITVNGKGEFASLKISVSQTRNLINQVVQVTWSGGKPTIGDATNYVANYLQIMQCWGDSTKGPDRTQCQFGAYLGSENRGGEWTASRRITRAGQGYVDPADELSTSTGNGQVPFHSVKGTVAPNPTPGFFSDFDRNTTNEVVLARTAGDGTGSEPFEVQTFVEAPGLGCGKDDTSSGMARSCWLVIVPRGEQEVDKSDLATIIAKGDHKVDTSPLSATNWASRIVIPLQFEAVGRACPSGKAEVPLLGVETVSEAIFRWQPSLCANDGPVYGLSQVVEGVAERKLTSESPAMVFLNAAVAPEDVPEDRRYVYAPVTVSGITIGVLIQRKARANAPESEKRIEGTPITTVNLTPRVVAKLLTQSYRYGADKNATYLSYADGRPYPDNLTRDPDFLADNPAFADQDIPSRLDIVLPLGTSSAIKLIWEWVALDEEAADFVAGRPDPFGMRVNPFYQGIALPQDTFPKSDPYCDFNAAPGAKPLCVFDAHPLALDFHEVARSVARGDSLARGNWDAQAQPPSYRKSPPDLNGLRHVLGVADSASAARFGLITAKLRNASGAFVGPTTEAMTAGAAVMRPSAVDGVRLSDPSATAPGAYPLTIVSYAITAPNKLTVDQANAYAGFLRHAAGAGQTPGTVPGTLPPGYAPLPATMKAQALAGAELIEARVGPSATTAATSTSTEASSAQTSAAASSSASGAESTSGTAAAGTTVGTGATSTAPVARNVAGTGVRTSGGSSQARSAAVGASPAPPGAVSSQSGAAQATGPGVMPSVVATPVGFAQPSSVSPSTGESGDLPERLTPTDVVGWVRYVTVVILLLGIAAALLGPALPGLVWRLEARGATPTSTTASQEVAPENTDEGTQRASDEAMATSA